MYVELKKVDGDKYWSIKEAARNSNFSAHTIRIYVSLGRLRGYKFKSLTLVRAADIMRITGVSHG